MSKKDIIIDFVKENIKSGVYKPGRRIMSEQDMVEKFRVAKMTVRSALDILVKEGIIYKKPYAGSFICDNGEKPKYIIICVGEATLIEDLRDYNLHLIDNLKENIKDKGFIPHLYLEKSSADYPDYVDFTENDIAKSITLDINEIAGIIVLGTNDENFRTYENAGIPIITIRNVSSAFPSVNLNYIDVYEKAINLFEKHQLNNVLIFHYYDPYFLFENQFALHYGLFRYLKDRYNVADIPLPGKLIEVTEYFDRYMSELKEIPQCIFFMDNTIYNASLPLFSKYDRILKNTKIIALSNNEELFPKEYKICRLTFYIPKIARIGTDLIIKLIKGKAPIRTNININCEILGENNLL
ncbi:MAG: winged helix-turn-helix transcriptional regulator [Armatimonadetes bacterium]|nr:winged helix-turn-helix transcriptional regulator [Candidatus Hippobium faecium]